MTVNGVALAQVWDGPRATGEGSFRSTPSGSHLPLHDLGLSWEADCLVADSQGQDHPFSHQDSAQLLTVTIQSVDGVKIDVESGFTISFRPVNPLELLRLSVAPHAEVKLPEQSEAWRDPAPHHRLASTNSEASIDDSFDDYHPQDASLRERIKELKRLEAEEAELKRLIREQKHFIKEQMKAEMRLFKTEIQQCDNLVCFFNKVLNGAKGAIKVVYYRLKPDENSFGHGHGHDHPPFEQAEQSTQHFSATDPPPPPPPPTPHAPHERPHDRPHHDFHPPPREHGPPPHPSWAIALEVILGLVFLGGLFTCLHHCLCTPRARRDRAASREERRNVRAYRRAARLLRWRRWLYGLDQERIDDYEEKRALILDQEDILEADMQDEIRMLREAHNVVNSIVQAEEGRGFRPTTVTGMGGMPSVHPHPSISPNPYIHAHRMPMHMPVPRPPSRTASLPDYRSEAGSMSDPPAYEDDEDTSDVVVDGFSQYTPSNATSSDAGSCHGDARDPWTPHSSVITTSPRASLETLETRRFDDVLERASRIRSGSVSSCSSSQFAGSEKSG